MSGSSAEETTSAVIVANEPEPFVLEAVPEPSEEAYKKTDTENIKISMPKNPMDKWDGKDMKTLLDAIPLDKAGQLKSPRISGNKSPR